MNSCRRTFKASNTKVQANLSEISEDTVEPHCNCQKNKKSECPLPDQCHTDQYGRVESVIYRAMITREDTGAIEHYTGLTGGTFKARWYGHMTDIRNYDPDDGSYGKRMSRYVGDLNSRDIPNTITWSIVCRAPTYNPVTKSCWLCLMESHTKC